MAWKTDKTPLEYLLQRVVYYEKMERKFINAKEKRKFGDRYSDEELDIAIGNTIKKAALFREASQILAQHQ